MGHPGGEEKRVLRFAQDDKICGVGSDGIVLRTILVGWLLWSPILPGRGEGWGTRQDIQVSWFGTDRLIWLIRRVFGVWSLCGRRRWTRW